MHTFTLKTIKEIYSHVGVRKYANNMGWLLVENLLKIIFGLFIGVWVARYLGPEQYGILSYVLVIVAMINPVTKLGIDAIIVRNLINKEDLVSEYLGTAFWIKTFSSIFIFLLIIISSGFIAGKENSTYLLVVSMILLFQGSDVIDCYFQSKVQSRFVALSRIIQLITISLLKIYLISSHASLLFFAATYVLDQVLATILLFNVYYKHNLPKFINSFDVDIAKGYLIESWPIILMGLATIVQARIDQIIISTQIGASSLAQYAIAISLIEMISFLPVIINSTIAPAIINAKKRSTELYHRRLQTYYSLMFIISSVVIIPILVLGKPMLDIIYGADYAQAGVLLSLLSFRFFFASMGVARSQFILNEKLFKYNLITTVTGAILSIILNIITIPVYGIIGAIGVSYFSYFISTFLIDMLMRKTRYNIMLMVKGIFKFTHVFTSWSIT